MIKLRKLPPDHEAHGDAIKWLAARHEEYLALFPNGMLTPTAEHSAYLHDYSKPRVKLALRAETRDKCAYCEWSYSPGAFGDVEHILPKANDWKNRLLNYDNLTIACNRCNNSKRDYENKKEPLINPYVTDPRDHLQSVGEVITVRRNSRIGTVAKGVLRLNRTGLLANRAKTVLDCQARYDAYLAEKNRKLRKALLREIIEDHDSAREFSMTRRAFYASVLPHLRRLVQVYE